MKKSWKSTIAAALAVVMLAGCGGGETSNSSADAKPSGEKRTEIVIAVGGDVSSLNPHNHNDVNSGNVTRSIYSNLVRVDENNEFVGDLAESWEYLDTKTAKFTLKPGITFSDGTPLTSEDVKFSIEDQKKSSSTGHLVEFIEEVEIIDDLNFILHLNKETNTLLSSLAHLSSSILCKSYCEKLAAEGKRIDDYPMGSGPYTFVEWVASTSVTLKKNPNYFDSSRMAQNDGFILRVIPEGSARTIALETGDVDMILNVGTSDANRIRETEGLALDEYGTTAVEFLSLNTAKAPFDDVRVRKAINYAINKEDVLIAGVNGEGTVLDSYLSPSSIGYYGTEVTYEHDVEKAKELLKEAGLENGFEFTVMLNNGTRNRIATVIQENLNQLGITMNIDQMETATFYEKLANGEHQACIAGWIPNAEADNTYRPLFTSESGGAGGNYSLYQNAEVDALIDEAAQSLDQAVVDADRSKVLEIISEDAIWVPLFSPKGMIARQADLQGVTGSPIKYQDFYSIHY